MSKLADFAGSSGLDCYVTPKPVDGILDKIKKELSVCDSSSCVISISTVDNGLVIGNIDSFSKVDGYSLLFSMANNKGGYDMAYEKIEK